ncbi:DUF2147 domain-containing protein [Pedobacter sp. SYP-B3415]|uniref:DUF2147 domain-containing protein n=1 Tax=Pedobacter sp. SYP-B3415 TaxID=2496641 RepID=UPI00101B96B7|nr:DUF2147 domain-containing protein [Pedobacter sp. SYP-B3415]
MRKTILTAVLMVLSASAFAQKFPTDQIVGIWQCPDYKIEFFKTGAKYSAKLLWSKDMLEADGRTSKKDSRNPDERLRNRPVRGLVYITALIYKDGEYLDGKLYSVQDGNTYSLKGKLNGINDLETRGYKGIPMMGKTFKWKRVQ